MRNPRYKNKLLQICGFYDIKAEAWMNKKAEWPIINLKQVGLIDSPSIPIF